MKCAYCVNDAEASVNTGFKILPMCNRCFENLKASHPSYDTDSIRGGATITAKQAQQRVITAVRSKLKTEDLKTLQKIFDNVRFSSEKGIFATFCKENINENVQIYLKSLGFKLSRRIYSINNPEKDYWVISWGLNE